LFEARTQGTLAEYVPTHWKSLTPEIFAALRVALTGILPGLRIGVRMDGTVPPSEEPLWPFSEAQALVWVGLSMSWLGGDDQGQTLEEELRRFVDESPVIEGAVERLFTAFDHVTKPELMFHSRFCLEAIRASLCATQKRPNPKADIWAELFFAQELALRLQGDALPPKLKAMTISEERARRTIGLAEARGVISRRLSDLLHSEPDLNRRLEQAGLLREVAAKAGHDDLFDSITGEVQLDIPVEDLADYLITTLGDPPPHLGPVATVFSARTLAKPLVKARRADDLKRVADAMIDTLGGTNEARAVTESWLGSCLKTMRLPQRFLEWVGLEPHPWEHDLPPFLRINLWMERSNALRLLGHPAEALSLIKEIAPLVTEAHEDELYRTIQLNLAILLRETGSPDAALRILEPLLDKTPLQDQLHILESLAATFNVVGRSDDAARCLDRALELALVVEPDRVPFIQATRDQWRTTTEHVPQPPQVLGAADLDLRANPLIAITQAAAWLNVLSNVDELPPAAEGQLTKLYEVMPTLIEDAEARNDAAIHQAALKVLALMLEHLDTPEPEAEVVWQELVHVAFEKYNQPPDPVGVIKLATYAFKRGDTETGRVFLTTVPQALADSLGGVQDLKPVVNSTIHLRESLNDVTSTILFERQANATWEDMRLVSELRRDMISRSRLLHRQDGSQTGIAPLTEGLTDEVVGRLAPATGRLAVLECADNGEYIAFFITCIDANGGVSSHWLQLPETDMDFTQLGAKMRTKLSNWTLNRPGDPFDLAAWRAFETWLVQGLASHLREGDHIVFIEHKDHLGIPWHVAVAPHWTSSYAASWTSLLEFHDQPVPTRYEKVGVVLVPRFADPPEVLAALRHSSQQAQSLATTSGLQCLMVEERTCDRDAFMHIVGNTDIAKLLCHGFIDPADGEMALMLAYNGRLPLGEAVASSSPSGQLHRLSWRECQQLGSASRVIFSAACSSGLSQIGGVAEQLGLFSALRHAGSRTLVAPRWDILATAVLPILDAAFAHYLRGGSLAHALYDACRTAAEANCPRWLAWSIAIEGDWR
jgi:tetratricopeptide (TPR) repeat protein